MESADEVDVAPSQLVTPPDIRLPDVPLLIIVGYMDYATLSAFARALMVGEHNAPTLQIVRSELNNRTTRVISLFDAVVQSSQAYSVDAITARMQTFGISRRLLTIDGQAYAYWRIGVQSLAVYEPLGGRIRKVTRMSPDECIQVAVYADGITESVCYSTTTYGSHRLGGLPATVRWHRNGVMARQEYVVADMHHRDGDLPAIQEWNDNGQLLREVYCKNDKIHRDGDMPAERKWDRHGTLLQEDYYENGEFHRAGGLPARRRWNPQGELLYCEYYEHGKLHRANDLPARTGFEQPSNIMTTEEYWVDGEPHRAGGLPACQRWTDQGGLYLVEYYEHGKLHRAGGLPARIELEPSSSVQITEEYWVDGQKHRDDLPNGTPQPAIIVRKPSGRIRTQQFWKNGWSSKPK